MLEVKWLFIERPKEPNYFMDGIRWLLYLLSECYVCSGKI